MNKDPNSADDEPESLSLEDQLKLTTSNIGIQNRPLILNRQLDNAQSQAVGVDHLFRLEFDPSTGIPAAWVDTKTLNFLNTLRDNIFASSSQFDLPLNKPVSEAKDPKKKKKVDPSAVSAPVDKDSVAYQRGKRSCTVSDLA